LDLLLEAVEEVVVEPETTDYNISAFGLALGIVPTYALRCLEQALVEVALMVLSLFTCHNNAS
jgi:hypothetical protein